jgi:hypothetical protein
LLYRGKSNRTGKPDAGFEIDQAMAALPAHASLPDRCAVQAARPLLFFWIGPEFPQLNPSVRKLAALPLWRQAAALFGRMHGGLGRCAYVKLVRRDFAINVAANQEAFT